MKGPFLVAKIADFTIYGSCEPIPSEGLFSTYETAALPLSYTGLLGSLAMIRSVLGVVGGARPIKCARNVHRGFLEA